MFASQVLCGFDMAKADKLRKVIGKKKKDDIAAFRTEFVNAAAEQGKVTRERADEIYTEIEFFGRYAFNLAHSAAYAVVSYYTGYLKAYYPAYFCAALLNKFCATEIIYYTSEDGRYEAKQRGEKPEKTFSTKKNDDEVLIKYLLETQTLGVTIEPPDINKSFMFFRPTSDRSISYGIGSLKGVGSSTQELINYREEYGNFSKLSEFVEACINLKINKKVALGFVSAGVVNFHTTSAELRRLFEGYERPKKNGEGMTKAKKSILDDVRELMKKRDKESKKYLEKMTPEEQVLDVEERLKIYKEGLDLLDKDLPLAPLRDFRIMDPPGIYRINKEVQLERTN